MKIKLSHWFAKLAAGVGVFSVCYSSHSQTVTASDFAAVPPLVSDAANPFVMISLSVELTQQAEAYTDAEQVYVGGAYCPGRIGSDAGIGVCYTFDEVYIGYFDPNKCYVYDTTGADTNTLQRPRGPYNGAVGNLSQPDAHYFRPISMVADAAGGDYSCSGTNDWSGHFLNWATMTALDEFRYAMVGGARLVDTRGSAAQTLLTRTQRYASGSSRWPFVTKAISSDGITSSGSGGSVTFTTNLNDVVPDAVASAAGDTLYIGVGENRSDQQANQADNRFSLYDDDEDLIDSFNAIVEVCVAGAGFVVEENCVEYTDGTNTWYKPEGVLQQNSTDMRFALMTYSAQSGEQRNGGVLRANAKYIGYLRPDDDGGLEVNPNDEVNEFGQFTYNPDNDILTGPETTGAVNSGIINYINGFGLGPNRYKSLDPLSELYYEGLRYIMGLEPTEDYYAGALGALTNDQRDNYPVVTNWDDPVLDACQSSYIVSIGDQFTHRDGDLPGTTQGSANGSPSGAPSDPPPDFNVSTMTDIVGGFEGIASLSTVRTGRESTFYVAGMAHWARHNDVRDGQAGVDSAFDGDQTVRSFFVDTQEFSSNPPMREDNHLWLAAKYGGFNDANGDEDPNNGAPPTGDSAATCSSNDEWDADGDCEPDAYTLASQPANLVAGLQNAFSTISEGVNAGSSAGVVSNTSDGQGLIVQGLYKPSESDGTNIVKWGGWLRSLFVDANDNIREDTIPNGEIDPGDYVIKFDVELDDEGRESVSVSRFNSADPDGVPVESGIDIEDIDTIWDARDQLASLTNVNTQRPYATTVGGSNGRRIYTSIDRDGDGLVLDSDGGDSVMIDFDDVQFPAIADDEDNNFRYLGLDSASPNAASQNIVNYIRGDDSIAGFRSRTVDYDGDGAEEVWRLGDIVTSAPVVVGEPKNDQRFDLIYDDDTNAAFNDAYRDRRQMVYVGANDGMLHAFNAGFFDRSNNSFQTTPGEDSGLAPHPLGAEMWAYVPFNALPHLRWLTELSYPHVYYVDGIPQVFDVNIFPNDATHPGGWGTILVVGMRFGGGEITLDPNSDADGNSDDDITTRSSYMVFDITNPEIEPELIAEITHPMMGFATVRPTVVKSRPQDGAGGYENSNDSWYLVLGSGPYGDDADTRRLALENGVSNQDAKLFFFDLVDRNFVSFTEDEDYLTVPNSSNAFVGDFVAADWDDEDANHGGYADDAIYFGTVSGSVSNPTGDLMRVELGNGVNFVSGATISRLVERSAGSSLAQPFSGLPFTRKINNDYWIFTGSGRFYNSLDQLNTAQMSYYGIREPINSDGDPTYATVNLSNDLVDVTGIQVQFVADSIDGPIFDATGASPFNVGPDGVSVDTFSDLQRVTSELEQGWFFDFDDPNLTNPDRPTDDIEAIHAGRSDGTGSTVGFTEYLPSGDGCNLGETFVNFVHFETGTAAPFSALGDDEFRPCTGCAVEVANRSKELTAGFVRDVEFIDGRLISQGSLGDLTDPIEPQEASPPSGRMSWREIIINW